MVEQPQGHDDAAFWVREGDHRIEGQDSNRRLVELRAGLVRHSRVRPVAAAAADEGGRRTRGALRQAPCRGRLEEARPPEPVVMAALAPPGLEPDIPVNATLTAAAREGIRPSFPAAERLLEGARFTYAVCRP